MKRNFSSNLRGKVRNFPLPQNRPLVPLYEAVVNSINAIDDRKKQDVLLQGKIEIEIIRDRTLFPESDSNTVKGFRVTDNGIGFDEDNMSSFMEADSEYKLAIGGKGVGRFSWLKAFLSVQISSTFKDDDTFVTRKFDFNLKQEEIEDSLSAVNESDEYRTTVVLNDYLKGYEKNVPKQIDTIAMRIIQHCFVYFLSDNCPEIVIFDHEARQSLNQMWRDKFSTDENTKKLEIGNQRFELLNIKITDKTFQHRNRLYLCANERLVDSKDLENLIVDLDSQIFDNMGYWYLGVLTSKYFDDSVDMNRLSFTIPAESSGLLPDYPGMDAIIKETCKSIEQYLKEYLSEVEMSKKERLQKYTTEIAPQYRHLAYYIPDKLAALKPGLSNEELDDKLYVMKRQFENQTKAECNDLLKKLDKGDISSEEYQKQFQETIEKVSDVNMAVLADYIVHRRIILNLFSRGLEIKNDGKFNLEKYMHQLIYPMRTTSEDMPYENHNLWLLDEKLSFCQFISSDKPFDNAMGEDRTDLLILDNPVAIAESKNTGSTYDSIIIFELKRPMRDDYNMESNPITQLIDYAQKIKDGKVKDSKHRNISTSSNTQFYLYALCDITPTLERVLTQMGFTRTADNMGAYKYNDVIHAYIEVMSYDKVRNDSEKRNKVLFDKLGIPSGS